MVVPGPFVDSPEGAAVICEAPPERRPGQIRVVVGAEVAPWLAEVVAVAHRAGVAVVVEAHPAPDLDPESRDGWEIGAITGALLAGVDAVEGVAAPRVQRVAHVLSRLRAGTDRHEGEVIPS